MRVGADTNAESPSPPAPLPARERRDKLPSPYEGEGLGMRVGMESHLELCLALVDTNQHVQQFQGIFLAALECVAADDRAEPATVADGPDLVKECLVIILLGAARENDDAVSIKGALHDVGHPISHRISRDTVLLIYFLSCRQLQMCARELHLDDVRAQLGRDLCRIRCHVQSRLTFLAQIAASPISTPCCVVRVCSCTVCTLIALES